MWTSFVAAVCLLLMLFHAGDSQSQHTTPPTSPTASTAAPVVTSPATTSNADNTATTTTPTPNTVIELGLNFDCTNTSVYRCGTNMTCDRNGHCKFSLGATCHGHIGDCVSGAVCGSSGVCECGPRNKAASNHQFCGGILSPGHICVNDTNETNSNNDYWCTENANCNGQLCHCDPSTHFVNHTTDCIPWVLPGKDCTFASSSTQNPCISGASCDGNVCQCNTQDYFEHTNNGCERQIWAGNPCSGSPQCVPNAQCKTVCTCSEGFYSKHSDLHKIQLCEPRKPGDGSSECNDNGECVENADCQGHCRCKVHFYLTAQGRCEPQLPWGSHCYASIKDECLEHGFCDANQCKCRDDAYRKLDNTCAPTLNYNSTCQLMNRDSKQCGSGTQCVFRSNDPNPVCACDIDHFFDGRGCVPRILVGNPCAYIDSTFRALRENQCVENAHCDFDRFHICVCDGGHYSREGYCPAQVAAGDTCDPWDHSENQCADYNTCVQGRCQ